MTALSTAVLATPVRQALPTTTVVAAPAQKPRRPLAYLGTEQFVVRSKLKMRVGCALDTSEAGILLPSAFVQLQELSHTADGIMRARVCECSASGEASGNTGWVSVQGKDGRSNLIRFHWTRFIKDRRSPGARSDTPDATVAKVNATPKQETTAPIPQVSRKPSVVIRSELAAKRDAASKAQPEPPAKMTTRLRAEARPAAPPPVSRRASKDATAPTGAASSSRPSAEATHRFRIQTVDEIRAIGARFNKEILEEQQKLGSAHGTLKATLGDALFKTKAKVGELVKSWSIKAEISKMDFRKHVRKVIEWQNVKEIDAFFSSIDADGGGTLDPDELTAAMRQLQNEANAAAAHDDRVRAQIDFLLSRVAMTEKVANSTASAEEHDRRYNDTKNGKTIEVSFLDALSKRSTKGADILASWEHTNGQISKQQFRNNLHTLAVEEEDEAIDKLFDSIDKDGGGTLDLAEIRKAIDTFKQAIMEKKSHLAHMRKQSLDVWKHAKGAQMELDKQLQQDLADQREREETAAQLEAEKEAKRLDAEEKHAARLRAKAQAEIEKKAAFDAKVQRMRQRRASDGLLPLAGLQLSGDALLPTMDMQEVLIGDVL